MTLLTRAEIAELLLRDAAAQPAAPTLRTRYSATTERAVAALQPGSVDAERQLTLILAYLEVHRYALVGLVRWPADDAVAMIRGGEADLVVAALAVKSGGVTAIETDVVEAGARVEYCREPARRLRRDVPDLADRMLARGLPPALVAELLEVTEDQVRVAVADRNRRSRPVRRADAQPRRVQPR